jgi:hypothetical protein
MVMAHEVRMVMVRTVNTVTVPKAQWTHRIQQVLVILRVHHMLTAHADMAIVIMVRDQQMHHVLLPQEHQLTLHSLIQRPVQILRLHRGLAIKAIRVIEVMGDKRDKVKRAVGAMVDKTT